MRCANCGNENFDTLTVRRFTLHCSVCGHNTHTATGIDTRKIKWALILVIVIVILAQGAWYLRYNLHDLLPVYIPPRIPLT